MENISWVLHQKYDVTCVVGMRSDITVITVTVMITVIATIIVINSNMADNCTAK